MDKKNNVVIDVLVSVAKDVSVYATVGAATLAAANEIRKGMEYFDKKKNS